MNSKAYYFFVVIYILFIGVKNLISINPFGLHFYSLYSSSMEPVIPPGSLVVVKNNLNYQIGDVIAYWAKIDNQEMIIAHRIVRLGGNVYITKGDSNNSDDSLVVLPRLVIGKIIFNLPLFGYLFSFLTIPIISFFLVFAPMIFIVFIESKRLRSLLS